MNTYTQRFLLAFLLVSATAFWATWAWVLDASWTNPEGNVELRTNHYGERRLETVVLTAGLLTAVPAAVWVWRQRR